MKNAKAKETKYRKHPELKPGIRIQYRDKNGASRSGRIKSRKGNFLKVAAGISVAFPKKVSIDAVTGYWNPRVKASPENRVTARLKKSLMIGRRT